MYRRDYGRPDDLRRMQSLVQRLWSPASRFHIGDLSWGRCSVPEPEKTFRTSLWEQGGEVLAWTWVEMPGHLDLLVDPDHPDLIVEALDWFEATAVGRDLTCMVMDGDADVQQALGGRGYTRRTDGPYFTRHMRSLVDLPDVRLPEGLTLASVPHGRAERRARAHRAGWSDFGSRLSTESYAAIMRTYPYRPETARRHDGHGSSARGRGVPGAGTAVSQHRIRARGQHGRVLANDPLARAATA